MDILAVSMTSSSALTTTARWTHPSVRQSSRPRLQQTSTLLMSERDASRAIELSRALLCSAPLSLTCTTTPTQPLRRRDHALVDSTLFDRCLYCFRLALSRRIVQRISSSLL